MSRSLSRGRLLRFLPAVAGLALLASSPAGATAASDTAGLPDRNQPMQVSVVRDTTPGCSPTCTEWVSAQGKIVPETRDAFLAVLRSLGNRKLPVFIDSVGGSVPDAMAIGRAIRARRLDVVVTRTALDGCGAKGCASPLLGRPHGIGAVCASACTLVLAAGEKREAAPWTLVGVHQIVIRQTMTRVEKKFRVVSRVVNGAKVVVSRTLVDSRPLSSYSVTRAPSPKAYAEVAAFLSEMGVGKGLLPLMLATPPTAIHWVSEAEARSTALVTDRVDGEYLVASAERASSTAVPFAAESIGIPEEALFVRAGTVVGKVQTSVGRVTWTLDRIASANPADVILRATVEVPDSGLRLDLRMARVPGPGSTASRVIDLAFATQPVGPVRKVDRIDLPQAGDLGEMEARYPLAGSVRTKGVNRFEVVLPSDAGRSDGNEAVVESQPWLGIPMTVDGGTRAVLMVQHVTSGAPLIAQAFQAWKAGSSQAFVPSEGTAAPRS